VKNKEVLIAYIPVLHEGYRKLLAAHPEAEVFVFGQEIIEKFDYLRKEIRALDPQLIVEAISSWKIVGKVSILDMGKLVELQKRGGKIVMPDEDVCHAVAEEYFKDREVVFVNIFLRWDRHNSFAGKPVEADQEISEKEFDKKMCKLAEDEAQKSSDWWRRIGSVLVKDGKIVLVNHNRHTPSEHMPYAVGDPRNAFNKGVAVELSSVIHSEAGIIAEAAAKGISLEGASLYVNTFPCPPCAKLIAYSGIKNLYYAGGYGVLDGESVLKSKGVKIIFVKPDQKSEGKEWKGYVK
jgi:dCMP deaminase